MKTIYTFLLLCIITFQIDNVKSQTTVTLESPSSSSRTYNLGAYFGYQRSMNLYTSAEIGTTNVSITSIQVNVATAGSASIPIKIYMKTQAGATIASSQTWSAVTSGATLVYNSNVTFNSTGWATIDITDYSYLSDNLLIYFESNYGGSGTSSYPYFYYGPSTNKQKYWYNDGSAPTGTEDGSGFRANVKITYSPIASSPTVTTTAISSIASTSATSGGNITSIGSAAVSVSGICWNTATDPTTSNSKTTDGATSATSFASNLSGLSAQTYYYVRAYATNSVDTSYGSNVGFYTYSTEPTGHSATFTATAAGPNQINLSFSAASGYGADGYLILGYAGSSAPSSSGVVDGVAYGSFSLSSSVTVITQFTSSSATSYSHTSVVSNTQYYYIIVPYNWDLTNTSTYNYLTAATIPSATATTPAGPSAEGMYIAGNLTNNGTIISTNDDNYMRMTGTSKTLSGTGTFTNTKYFVDGTISFTGTFAGGAMTETFVNTSKSLDIATAKTFKNGLLTNYGTVSLTGTGIWENTGNYINNSTFTTASSSLLKFNGTSAQTITELTPTTFSNVTIDNTAGVSMLSSITVANTLTLTNGKFIVGGNKTLSIGSISANGTISGGSSSSYIVAYNNGSTTGTLKHFVNVAASTVYNLPIGDATSCTPMTFRLDEAALSNAYITVYTKPSKIATMNASVTNYLNRYWDLTPSGITGALYRVTYTYVTGDIVGVEDNFFPVKRSLISTSPDVYAWYKPTETTFSSGTEQGVGGVDADANILTWRQLSTFSQFSAAGDQIVNLPIDLLSFDAKKQNQNNLLFWSTATETNSDYFTVEKTIDGASYEVVGNVNGGGTSFDQLDYSLVDYDVRKAINYYRLKQTDTDGAEKISALVSVDNRENLGKVISMKTNLLGQEINENYRGIVIIIFEDGTSIKIIQ